MSGAFFTKSFLGDDVAVLAPSSGEEPAPLRHRAGVDERAVNLISTQVESLLTLQLVDGIADDGNRGSTRQECIGQGLGNLASGLTGGQGGCALIGQSLINVEAGGTSRLSGMVMAGGLAAGLVSAAPLLGPAWKSTSGTR